MPSWPATPTSASCSGTGTGLWAWEYDASWLREGGEKGRGREGGREGGRKGGGEEVPVKYSVSHYKSRMVTFSHFVTYL